MVSRLWTFLQLDPSPIAALDAADSDVRDAKAVVSLAEVLAVEGPTLRKLAPFLVNLDSMLDALNSPLEEIAAAVLSFIPIGPALLRLYTEHTHQEPTLAQKIILISQAAYLEAIKTLLAEPQLEKWLAQVGDRPASNAVRQKIQRLITIELKEAEAQRTLRSFQSSTLAAAYSEVLIARLSELGIEPRQAGKVALQLTQQTHKVLLLSLSNSEGNRSRRAATRQRSTPGKRPQSPNPKQTPQRTPKQSPTSESAQQIRPQTPKPPPPPPRPPEPPLSRGGDQWLTNVSESTAADIDEPPLSSTIEQLITHPTESTRQETGRSLQRQKHTTELPKVIDSFLPASNGSHSRNVELVEVSPSAVGQPFLSEVSESSPTATIAPTSTQLQQPSSPETVDVPPDTDNQPFLRPSVQPTQSTQAVTSASDESVPQSFAHVSEPPLAEVRNSTLSADDELPRAEVTGSSLPEISEPLLSETADPDLLNAINQLLPEADESLPTQTVKSPLTEGEPDLPETIESFAVTEPLATERAETEVAETEVAETEVAETEVAETAEVTPDLSLLTINELVALEAKGGIRPAKPNVNQPDPPQKVSQSAPPQAAEVPSHEEVELALQTESKSSPAEGSQSSNEMRDSLSMVSLSPEVDDPLSSDTGELPSVEEAEQFTGVSVPLLSEAAERSLPEPAESSPETVESLPTETVESFSIQPHTLPLSEIIEPPPVGAFTLPDLEIPALSEPIEVTDVAVETASPEVVTPAEQVPLSQLQPETTAPPVSDVDTDEPDTAEVATDAVRITDVVSLDESNAETASEKDPKWFQLEVDTAVRKQLSIDTYLTEWIAPRPHEPVFGESFSFNDIYVPLKAELLTPTLEAGVAPGPVELAQWVRQCLDNEAHSQDVVVLQAEPGRGKSLFCSLFADWVRCHEHPGWTPILIHLRDVEALSETFEATLAAAINREFATVNADWLNDRTARFLFLLDGVDKLRVPTEDLAKFLQQAGQFQAQYGQEPQTGHRLILTTRPLALQAIAHALPSNLTWLEILPMDDEQQQQWCDRWVSLVGSQKVPLRELLQSPALPEWIQELSHEPLLLYRLAALHREGELDLEKFASDERATAEILICDRILNWLVTHRRPEQPGQNGSQLSPHALHHILQEVGLCIAQSAGAFTTIQAVRDRLAQDSSTVSLATASASQLELGDFALWNVLTAFYLRPGEMHAQSLEFEYERWGEFFYIKRLTSGLTALCQQEEDLDCMSDAALCWMMYDLFSCPGLTCERVAYLMTLLVRSPAFDAERLHQRLYGFYWRWCQGEFIDATAETLPQKALRLLAERTPEQTQAQGQRQIDAQVGLNTLILLLELYRYGRLLAESRSLAPEAAERLLFFHPCSNADSEQFEAQHLLQLIGVSQCLGPNTFRDQVGPFLNQVDLRGADLSHTDLAGADLHHTDLRSANLNRATLREANLADANLRGTNLNDASLRGANLQNAHLRSAQLFSADLFEVNCQGANLSSVDLRRARLTNAIFSQADMSQANFSSADLRSSRFCETNLRSAIMRQVDLADADLSGANLSNADLSETMLRRSQLSGAILHQTNLSGVNLSETDLSGANLSGANLSDANLSGALLVGTDLSGANLKGTNFHKANLSGANLEGARCYNTSFDGTNFEGANLRGTNLSGLDFDSANFSEVDLRSTNFSHSILRSALFKNALFYATDFSSADLRNTDLSGTSLIGVTLFEANLFEANLSEADLSGVNLFQAKLVSANLTDANLSGANLSRANCFEADFGNANLSDTDLFEANLGMPICRARRWWVLISAAPTSSRLSSQSLTWAKPTCSRPFSATRICNMPTSAVPTSIVPTVPTPISPRRFSLAKTALFSGMKTQVGRMLRASIP